jgi:hypothetical protein
VTLHCLSLHDIPIDSVRACSFHTTREAPDWSALHRFCTVCQSHEAPEEMAQTLCEHFFCPRYVFKVIEITGRCPNRRSEVETVFLFGSTVNIARVPQEDTSENWMPERYPDETDVEFERRWLLEYGLEDML